MMKTKQVGKTHLYKCNFYLMQSTKEQQKAGAIYFVKLWK